MCSSHLVCSRHWVRPAFPLPTTLGGVGKPSSYLCFTQLRRDLFKVTYYLEMTEAGLDLIASGDPYGDLIHCRELCDMSNQHCTGATQTFSSVVKKVYMLTGVLSP